MRFLLTLTLVFLFGVVKLPAERSLLAEHRQLNFRAVTFDLDLRERIGQLGFMAALS